MFSQGFVCCKDLKTSRCGYDHKTDHALLIAVPKQLMQHIPKRSEILIDPRAKDKLDVENYRDLEASKDTFTVFGVRVVSPRVRIPEVWRIKPGTHVLGKQQ